jgi:competence protein ComFC
MKQAFYDIPKAALNLIFPLYCQGCEIPLGYNNNLFLCDNCSQKLKNLTAFSTQSRESAFFFEKAYHCCPYEDMVKNLIHKFKYSKKIFLKTIFSNLLYNTFTENLMSENIDIIMPVPMHHSDERKRGLNQSAILAKELSEKKGTACKNILVKYRKTPSQTGLKRADRLINVKNAFSLKGHAYLNDKNVLIVDDVFTTGSTINECARILKSCGAGSVLAITIAKGI